MHLETHLPLLLDLILKSTVLLAFAGVVGRLSRGASAANRHVIAVAALAICTAAQLRAADEKPVQSLGKESSAVDANAGVPQVLIESKFMEITAGTASDPAMSWLPAPPKPGANAGGGSILLTDEQARDAIGMAGRKKGVDVLSAPSVVTRSKQRAIVEIIREFRNATEWEKDGKPGSWKPKTFETKNVGVTLDVEPAVQADGSIKLHLAPQVVKFLGFIDLDAGGKDAQPKADLVKPLNDRLWFPRIGVVPDGHRAQPVFSTRRMMTDIVVQPGETLLLECGAADVEKSAVEGKGKGKAKADAQPPPRRLVVLVTARIAEPGGIPAPEPKPDNAKK